MGIGARGYTAEDIEILLFGSLTNLEYIFPSFLLLMILSHFFLSYDFTTEELRQIVDDD